MSLSSQPEFADATRISAGRRILQRLHIDLPLLVGLLLLAAAGLFILYSAGDENLDLVIRQGLRLALAFAVMFVIAQLSPSTIQFWSPWLFGIGLLMLVAVLIGGEIGKGAQRWLDLGVLRFQPSEIMKLAVPMMLAWYLAEAPLPPNRVRIFIAAVILLIPTLLIAKQPDLGTALLIASASIFVLWLAGLGFRLIATVFTLFAAVTPVVWIYLLHDYQRRRVLTFLNPDIDPLGAGYHIRQSKIAIGSGGMYGKGWLNGTQSHLDFLPERSTDFIFAVFSEEFGFLGLLILLGLYLFVVWRGLYISAQAQDTFCRLLAGSITLTFFVYIFVNMGMVSGLLPVVGVPLPLLSYGGTSIVTLLAGFGILMSIQTHRKLIST
ncbi:MAG: rod shape-determining protein RodA [Proteobacteria bacterium]|jgi:rod shape determining protein RodA|nr:rod shape-determining protein RodA [Pseudomonadota bacterium]MCG6934787.1 rod shape-determining protein RodA [Pseudomonadota bacterium]